MSDDKTYADVGVYIGSLPRSGSTYLKYLIHYTYHPLVPVDKSHNPADHLRIISGDKNQYLTIFVVRPVLDGLVSQLVWHTMEKKLDEKLIRSTLEDHCWLWEIVLADPKKFFIVDFNSIKNNPQVVMAEIERNYTDLVEFRRPEFPNAVDAALERLTLDGKNMGEEVFLLRGCAPRPDAPNKGLIIEALKNPLYSKRIEYLESLYEEFLTIKDI